MNKKDFKKKAQKVLSGSKAFNEDALKALNRLLDIWERKIQLDREQFEFKKHGSLPGAGSEYIKKN